MRNSRIAILLGAVVALSTTACTRPGDDAAKPGSAASAAAEKPKTVATVNGKELTQPMFDTFLQAVTGKPAAEATPEQKTQLLDQLVAMTLAAQAAEKDGLGKDPLVQARMDLLRTQILAEAASEKYMKAHPVSDTEVKAEYDTQIAAMPKEYKARHILVETKETADSLIRDLQAVAQGLEKKGVPSAEIAQRVAGDFAKLAKSESKDAESAAKGGDLGWFSAQSMVKPFSDALATLEKGKITTAPVQTQYGWHVIQLEDTRSPEPPAFDDVKQQVEMLTQRKKLQTYLDELRKTAKIQKTS